MQCEEDWLEMHALHAHHGWSISKIAREVRCELADRPSLCDRRVRASVPSEAATGRAHPGAARPPGASAGPLCRASRNDALPSFANSATRAPIPRLRVESGRSDRKTRTSTPWFGSRPIRGSRRRSTGRTEAPGSLAPSSECARNSSRRSSSVMGFLAIGRPSASRLQASEAARRPVLASSVYLGYAQLSHTMPGLLPHAQEARLAFLNDVVAASTS
jgi:hypothetical protein